MQDSPAFISLISRYRPRLSWTFPRRLFPGTRPRLLKPTLSIACSLLLFSACTCSSAVVNTKKQTNLPVSRVLHLGLLPIRYITIWPAMDPAHTSSPQDRFERLEEALHRQQERMATAFTHTHRSVATLEHTRTTLAAQVQQLTSVLTQQTAAASAIPPPPPVPGPPPPSDAPEPRVGTPERYAGDPEGCGPFLTNCSILFALQPRTFATEKAKVAYAINHLTGRARLWGTAEWDRETPACSSFQAFAEEFRKVFGMGADSAAAGRGLFHLCQGTRSVSDYSIEFRTQALRSNWNVSALCDAFLHGLADYIKDELVSYDLPATLDELIGLATWVDHRVQARRREKRQEASEHQAWSRPRGAATSATPARPAEQPQREQPTESLEPMQVGRSRLSAEERQRRRQNNLCLYCGQGGHFLARCPLKARAHL